MEENTKQQIIKEVKMNSGEEVKMLIELTNIEAKNYSIVKDILETIFEDVKALF